MQPKVPFANGLCLQYQSPKTFEIPSFQQKSNLKINNFIKVSCANERFWAKIKNLNGFRIMATIDNNLLLTHIHGLCCGDEIEVTLDNIIDFFNEESIKMYNSKTRKDAEHEKNMGDLICAKQFCVS